MTREISYKIRILRNGAHFSELRWEAGSAPRLDMDAGADIKSSFQGTFLAAPDFDPLKDELQPLLVENGQETPLGVFCCTSMTTSAGQGRRMNLEAYDRAWKLQSTVTEELLYFKAGAKYLDAVEQLLIGAGIGSVLKTDSPAVLPVDREDWDIGTDYLSIVNQLLGEIGYEDIWFDAGGYAHIEPYVPPSAAAIKRTYSARNLQALPMLPEVEEETDLFDAPNVFIYLCSNADRTGVLTATAVNDSPLSSRSVFRRGRRIAEVTRVDQVADQAALQALADRAKFESMLSTRTVTFAVPAEAGHEPGDVIAIDHEDYGGIYTETGWSLTLAAGEAMTMTAKRTVIE